MNFEKWNSLLKLTLTVGLILGLGLMAGCGDDDDDNDITDPGGGIGTGGTITATIDGSPMVFDVNASSSNPSDPDSRFISGGVENTDDVMVLYVPEDTGTYTIPNIGEAGIYFTDSNTTWTCVSGSIILSTSTDTNIAGSFIGTFEDMALNVITVTNGSFDVPVVLVQ